MAKNNKRYRKQKQTRNFPWLVVVLGGGLLVLAAVLFANRGGLDTGGGTPKLTVDQNKIDYGYVKFGNNKQFSIKVTNDGDGTLRIQEKPYVEVLEGCWPPDLTIGSMVLKPGESTQVDSSIFMMHPGMDGKHDYAVHLKTNDPSNPDLVVHVLSDWGP